MVTAGCETLELRSNYKALGAVIDVTEGKIYKLPFTAFLLQSDLYLSRYRRSKFRLSKMAENIWLAASDGLLDAVKGFVASGVSVNAQDENGYW